MTRRRRRSGEPNSFAFEPVHGGAFKFAVGVAFFDVFAFIELDFAFADCEGDFDLAVFPVEGEREEGVAFD